MDKNKSTNGKKHGQQSVNSAVKSICDVMRRSNCAGAMKYVPELTWILFLRILDERETQGRAGVAIWSMRASCVAPVRGKQPEKIRESRITAVK